MFIGWIPLSNWPKSARICAKSLFGPDATGNTPLHYAAMNNSATSVDALLNCAMNSGVDVAGLYQPNDKRRTPLHCAAMNESDHTFGTVLRWAKNNGVPLHQLIEKDLGGRTPLHLLSINRTTTVKYEEAVRDILRLAHERRELAAILKRDLNGRPNAARLCSHQRQPRHRTCHLAVNCSTRPTNDSRPILIK
jgi:Ankyrin repeats (3 copies)